MARSWSHHSCEQLQTTPEEVGGFKDTTVVTFGILVSCIKLLLDYLKEARKRSLFHGQ